MSDPQVGETVAALVTGYAVALAAVEPASQRAGPGSQARMLRDSLWQLGPAIDTGYRNKLSDAGPEFAIGDEICRRELRSCLEDIERDVVAPLTANPPRTIDWRMQSTPRDVHKRAKRALDAQRDRMKRAEQPQQSNGEPNASQPPPSPEIPRSSTESSNNNAPVEASSKPANSSSILTTGGAKIALISRIPTSIKWSGGWGRSRRVQQYCPAALWQQGAGVAKTGIGHGLLGCPDCKWGHHKYPPDLISPYVGDYFRCRPLNYAFTKRNKNASRDQKTTYWTLPHRFFSKSHLYVPDEMVSGQNVLRGHQVFGCILCDKKKKAKDFDDPVSYAKHVEEEHSVEEFKKEIDINQSLEGAEWSGFSTDDFSVL